MFDSPLSPPNAATSLELPQTQYHPHSPTYQLVPLTENHGPPVPFSLATGTSPLSPNSPHIPLPIDPGSSAALLHHRASVSSTSTVDASSSKGSPASPLVNLPANPAAPSTSTSSTAAKPPKPAFVLPPPPPPLSNPLDLLQRSRVGLSQLIGHGNIDARPSRQATASAPLKSGACTACRVAKAKCSQTEPSCSRCVTMKIDCNYPVFAKRGRKRTMTPNQVLLENCHRDIEQALAILASGSPHTVPPPLPPIHPQPPSQRESSTSQSPLVFTAGDEEESGSARELKDVLENPLALLAHISSLKVGGDSTTDEESGKLFLPQQTNREPEPTVEGYFATGLYQLRSDADPAYDPVTLGIITEQTLERFVDFYFSHLQPFIFHLTPSIHTPRFLRDTSPFLTTALSCICATFDPASQSIVPALFHHLQLINTRIWSEGLKSLEIVQAYMLLIHWTPIANNWGDDRRWGWLGTALRIATEIKLHKTLNQVTYDFYRSVTPLSDDAFQKLSDDRGRSWRLISVSETALGVSTGRLGAISNLCSVWPGPPTPSNLSKDHVHYNLYALLELTKIYANAICLSNNVTDAEASTNFDIRSSFKSKYSHDLLQWRQTWVHANHYVRMIYSHNLTILLSISLRFRGPVGPILDECSAQAFETATLAVRWPDDSFRWGSNISVVVVAYAATLLLRIDATKPGALSPTVVSLCAAVADTLLLTGATRPQTRTLATLHGTRIRTLLAASTSPTIPQPLPSSLLPSDLTTHLHHADIHATFENVPDKGSPQLFPPVFPGTEPLRPLLTSTTTSSSTSRPSVSRSDNSIFEETSSTEPVVVPGGTLSVNEIRLGPNSDHLWSLPSNESHMLWDLFHDHRPNSVVTNTTSSNPLEEPTRTSSNLFNRDPTTTTSNSLSPGSSSILLQHSSLPTTSLNSRPSTSASGQDLQHPKASTEGRKDGTASSEEPEPASESNRTKRGDSKKRQHSGASSSSSSAAGVGGIVAEEGSMNDGDWVHRNALETDWLNSEPGAWAW
ncbi:uncharacterized protein JCM15063_001064 [Sporobolomyces koalae]|uniref:uncharacterized protein n=1 Tax=Sporobolomyces koalae TaxID=500713 RepID=UPI00316E251E